MAVNIRAISEAEGYIKAPSTTKSKATFDLVISYNKRNENTLTANTTFAQFTSEAFMEQRIDTYCQSVVALWPNLTGTPEYEIKELVSEDQQFQNLPA